MAKMTRNLVRAALTTRWTALLTAGYATGAPAPQVTRHATDKWIGRERVVVDASDGPLSIATQRAGIKTLQDEYELTVFVAVAVPGWSPDQIEDRCTVLVETLITDLATSPALDGAVTGLAWCRPGQTRMYSELVDIAGAPTVAYVAEVTLEVMVRG